MEGLFDIFGTSGGGTVPGGGKEETYV